VYGVCPEEPPLSGGLDPLAALPAQVLRVWSQPASEGGHPDARRCKGRARSEAM